MITTVIVSPQEVAAGKLTPENFETATAAMKRDGCVVLQDVIDLEHIRILREKMLEDVALFTGRENAPFNFNRGNVQQDPPPFPPYLFKDVLLNELVIQVTKAILGKGMKNNFYSGNTAVKSDLRQPVHVDVGQLWSDMETASPTFGIVVNVPVVDVSVENGSTELWLKTHLIPAVSIHDPKISIPEEELERARREGYAPIQADVKAGSAVLRDIRLWHAGVPNHTDTPRPMIAMIHWCGWMDSGDSLRFPKGTEEFFNHPDLKTQAVFTDEPIDYIQAPHAYDFEGK